MNAAKKVALRTKVLEDVKKLIEANVLTPRLAWAYVQRTVDEVDLLPTTELTSDKTLGEVLTARRCDVCARGALFVSRATSSGLLAKDYLVARGYSHGRINSLSYSATEVDLFSDDELDRIEGWFERGHGSFAFWGCVEAHRDKSTQYTAARVRLEFIVDHMLRNNSNFVEELFAKEVAHAEANAAVPRTYYE